MDSRIGNDPEFSCASKTVRVAPDKEAISTAPPSGGVLVLGAPYHFDNSLLVCGESLTRLKTLLACEMFVIFSACMRW